MQKYLWPNLNLVGYITSRGEGFWLAIIVILAISLRIFGIDAPLWYDEFATVETHISLPWGDMMRDYSMNHHYLFSVQAKLTSQVFGDANWAYRFPAMIFGTLTVAAIWWLARDIAGPRIAHAAALLTALSYHQVWFSQNARGYTELAFWCTLGLILFLRGLAAPTYRIWIAFGVSLVAAVLTHLTAAFFFIALGVVWTFILGTSGQKFSRSHVIMPICVSLLGLALIFLAYIPLLPSLLETLGNVSSSSALDPMKEYQNPLWTIFEGARTAFGRSGLLMYLAAASGLLAIGLGALGSHRSAPLFAPIVCVHVCVTIAALLALEMRIWPRFFFVDIGLFLVLIVIGCDVAARQLAKIAGRPQMEKALYSVAIFAMAVLSVGLLQRNYAAPKQDMSAAFQLAEEFREPGERIYSIGPSSQIYNGYFEANWGSIRTPQDYLQALADPGPFTVVVTFPARSFRTLPQMKEDIGETLQIAGYLRGTLGDGDIFLLKRK